MTLQEIIDTTLAAAERCGVRLSLHDKGIGSIELATPPAHVNQPQWVEYLVTFTDHNDVAATMAKLMPPAKYERPAWLPDANADPDSGVDFPDALARSLLEDGAEFLGEAQDAPRQDWSSMVFVHEAQRLTIVVSRYDIRYLAQKANRRLRHR